MAWGQNKLEARHPENEKQAHAVFEKNLFKWLANFLIEISYEGFFHNRWRNGEASITSTSVMCQAAANS